MEPVASQFMYNLKPAGSTSPSWMGRRTRSLELRCGRKFRRYGESLASSYATSMLSVGECSDNVVRPASTNVTACERAAWHEKDMIAANAETWGCMATCFLFFALRHALGGLFTKRLMEDLTWFSVQ
jgi:hypothetical protein